MDEYSYVIITKSDENKNTYVFRFASSTSVGEKWITCDKKERERFELAMISNPKVKYTRDTRYVWE